MKLLFLISSIVFPLLLFTMERKELAIIPSPGGSGKTTLKKVKELSQRHNNNYNGAVS